MLTTSLAETPIDSNTSETLIARRSALMLGDNDSPYFTSNSKTPLSDLIFFENIDFIQFSVLSITISIRVGGARVYNITRHATLVNVKNIKTIFTYTSGLRGYFIVIGITAVLSAILAFANPFGIKIATDWIVSIVSGNVTFSLMPLFLIVGVLSVISLFGVAVQDVGGYFGDQLAVRTRRQLSNTYYRHLSKLPQHYYDNEVTGKIINRLSRAITDITDFLQFFSNNLLQLLITIVITVGVLLWYSWPIALLFILLIPANLYLTARSSIKWQVWEKEKNHHFDIASGRFSEVIGQMRLVKSFRTEEQELMLLDSEMSHMVGITSKQSRHWHWMNALRGVAFVLLNGGMFGLLFYHTAKGNFTLGDLAMLLALIQQASFPVRNVSFFVDRTQRAVANSKD